MPPPPSDHARALRISIIGLFINAALGFVKILAGLLGNSYALIADGIESTADILASVIVWSGLRIAARPADENHPYGHGKAEPVAALFVALMLFGAGLAIAIEAVHEIITPHHAPAAFTLWVLVGVVIVKEALFRIVHRVSRATGSSAVLTDAWHHRSDALTSAAALIGISVALLGGPGWEPADDWAALFAAGVILFNGWHLLKAPLRELMDAEPDKEFLERLRAAAQAVSGVRGVEKIFARKSGMRYWVDMHVEVDPDLPVRDAHQIAHDVKNHVRAALPNVADVLVHIEPFRGSVQI